jgi:hypothetical protein
MACGLLLLGRMQHSVIGLLAVVFGCASGVGCGARYRGTLRMVHTGDAAIGVVGHQPSASIAVPPGATVRRELSATINVPRAMVVDYVATCDGQPMPGRVGQPWEEFYAQALAHEQAKWDEAFAKAQKDATEAQAEGEVRVQAGPVSGRVNVDAVISLQPGMPPRPTALPPHITGATTHKVAFPLELTPMQACTFEVNTNDVGARSGIWGTFAIAAKIDIAPNPAAKANSFRGELVASLEAQGARTRPRVVAPPRVAVVPPKAVVMPPPVVIEPPKVVVTPPRRVAPSAGIEINVGASLKPDPVQVRLAWERGRDVAVRDWRIGAMTWIIAAGADTGLRARQLAEREGIRARRKAELEAYARGVASARVGFRASVDAYVRRSGARDRPGRPANISEQVPPAPSAQSEWHGGSWAFNEAAWRWEWHPGTWKFSVAKTVSAVLDVAGQVTAPAPPAARVEVVTAPPSPGAAWVRGTWVWRDGQWQWSAGYWVQAQASVRVEVRP